MSTYTAAHKRYNEKNRELIKARRKEYMAEYQRQYRLKNKAKIKAWRKDSDKRQRKQALLDSVYNQPEPGLEKPRRKTA